MRRMITRYCTYASKSIQLLSELTRQQVLQTSQIFAHVEFFAISLGCPFFLAPVVEPLMNDVFELGCGKIDSYDLYEHFEPFNVLVQHQN